MRKFKYFIAKLLGFVPDPIMLRVQYFIKLKRLANIERPTRFTEKIQWYKAYYRNNEMLACTDKYLVREVCRNKLGTDKYLNELYYVCENANEIDFDKLPNSFVIKTTDGGNGDNILVCRNKAQLDRIATIKQINKWRNKRYDTISREWAYKGAKKSLIIIEKLLVDPHNNDNSIDDYKFLCYNGKFKFLWVDKNRYSDHKRGFWDENLNFLHGVRSDKPTFKHPPKLPSNIHEMIYIAEMLASGFPFARIDLYNISGKIYFGEITFYPWSGYVKYTPDTFDFDLGKHFIID